MQNPPMFMLANSSGSVIASINAHYHYTPQTFHNGNGDDCVTSPAGMEQDAFLVLRGLKILALHGSALPRHDIKIPINI